MELKPIMKCFSKRDFKELKHKYSFTISTSEKKVEEAKDSDVLVLQVQFRNGKHMIDNVWVLNEETPDVFMELMFGSKQEENAKTN